MIDKETLDLWKKKAKDDEGYAIAVALYEGNATPEQMNKIGEKCAEALLHVQANGREDGRTKFLPGGLREAHMNVVRKWFEDARPCRNGDLIPTDEVLKQVNKVARKMGILETNNTELGKVLEIVCPGVQRKRLRIKGARVRCYAFPQEVSNVGSNDDDLIEGL